jgi:hypothetical protein
MEGLGTLVLVLLVGLGLASAASELGPVDGGATEDNTVDDGTTQGDGSVASPSGQAINVYLTTYNPWLAVTAAQQQMEGGVLDRHRDPLIPFESHRDDPVTYPYFSVAGDYLSSYDGQTIAFPSLGTPPGNWQANTGSAFYLGKVVDTGGHFHAGKDGAIWDVATQGKPPRGTRAKVIRVPGCEPFDLCFQSVRSASELGLGVGQQVAYLVGV